MEKSCKGSVCQPNAQSETTWVSLLVFYPQFLWSALGQPAMNRNETEPVLSISFRPLSFKQNGSDSFLMFNIFNGD